jgi:prephenate dehydrogenase
MRKKDKRLNIAIIGYGRFGSLLAEILKPYGRIFVISSRKIKSKGIKQIKMEDLGKIDWIIPCVPISLLKTVLKKIKPFIRKGALITDVCSVKAMPCRWLKEILPPEIEVIGTHPMFGPDSAKRGLKGLQVVVCPVRNSEGTFKRVTDVFRKMKLKIIKTTPEEHDRQAAVSLSLVHFIGRALASVDIKARKISTVGFERLLAVCETVNNDTWQLFVDMQKYNPYAGKIRRKFIQSLKKIEKEINKK